MAEYIDREAAICEIKQITAVHYGSMWDYAVHCYAGACLRDCKEAICGIPAADVAPVMHGKWIHESNSDAWVCSRCGRGVNANPEGIDLYCYHCGAKMDEMK